MVFQPRVRGPEMGHKETSDGPWLIALLPKEVPVFFFLPVEDRKRLRNCSRLKDTEETRQLNAMHDPGLVPGSERKKRHS